MAALDSATPLSALPAGGEAVIRALRGGRDFCSRVANLGFTAGAAVKVMQNYGHGPMLVSVRGTLVALGRHEAAQVLVASVQ
jgi:ferrous iron transport protein A